MVTVSYYLKRPYDKNGKLKSTPVTITGRVNGGNGLRHDIPAELIDEKAIPLYWDSEKQRATRKDPAADLINKQLSAIDERVTTIYRENRDKSWAEKCALIDGNVVTVDEKKSLLTALDKFIAQYKREKNPLTVKNYQALKGHLEAMPAAVSFTGMDANFDDTFSEYLFGLGHQKSTVNKYRARLKKFLRWAIDRNYSVHPKFEGWKITNQVKRVFAITWPQLKKLDSAKLTGRAAIGRAAFMMLAGTGARISDGKHFNKKVIINTLKGPIWSYYQTKNGMMKAKKVTVPLNGPLGELALKYLREQRGRFPKLSEQKLRKWARRAFAAAKINLPEKVKLHTARKTFITLALHYMPPMIVMEATGIESYSTIRHYAARADLAVMQTQFEEMGQKLKAS